MIFYGLTIVFYGLICFLWFFLWVFYAFSIVCRWFFHGLFLWFLYGYLQFSMIRLYFFIICMTFLWSIMGNLWLIYGFSMVYYWFSMIFYGFYDFILYYKFGLTNTQSMCLLFQTQLPIIMIMWIGQFFFLVNIWIRLMCSIYS